jgi:hypothetical protein
MVLYYQMLTGLVPFMDNKVYGRSPLEAASFVVSSAFPDAKLHGASFLARLSGSTAEFLSMWSLMMAGPSPFVVNGHNQLQLKLSPILPSWLFNTDGTLAFTFLGKVKVTYHNPTKADTWKVTAVSSVVTFLDGSQVTSNGAVIDSFAAKKVRDGQAESIEIYF